MTLLASCVVRTVERCDRARVAARGLAAVRALPIERSPLGLPHREWKGRSPALRQQRCVDESGLRAKS